MIIRMPCGRKRSDEQVTPCKWHLFAEKWRHGEKKLQTERQVVRRKRGEPFQNPLMYWHEQEAGSRVTKEGQGISHRKGSERRTKGNGQEQVAERNTSIWEGWEAEIALGWNCTWCSNNLHPGSSYAMWPLLFAIRSWSLSLRSSFKKMFSG